MYVYYEMQISNAYDIFFGIQQAQVAEVLCYVKAPWITLLAQTVIIILF